MIPSYTIDVTLKGEVRVNGSAIAPHLATDEVLVELGKQINGSIAAGQLPTGILILLRDERPDGGGYQDLTLKPGENLRGNFYEMSPLTRAALTEPPAWARAGRVRPTRHRQAITRSLADAAPALVPIEEIEEGRDRRARRVTVIVVAAIVLLVGARVATGVDWGSHAYAAGCEDVRTGLRVANTDTCGNDRFHELRYLGSGETMPAVGESFVAGSLGKPSDARSIQKTPRPGGGTVGSKGLVEAAK
ncbi:hypothetical protein GCM10025867_47700 (plasmid) [Frondihabitans sucicola]|uniref:Uncharacterized protein n=1 Tax=Frondihabitans sucicola TaxID=1268041 RepID=A0ABM8GVN3_9MICO|nr:hypothetical protein [Frondihabitans sucicola]BDZ52529.1 hypothetical protein GCM10025867_47700 [Frondihabitans sucicola]